ncbi:MAG: right-handed parallel beta-helix repeat-containing protein [Candidatus Magnetomorum sp.]|nr:right-handed parallel beta-helix repeat-containing protein [Candidatus Magnetomorum sp.]
MKKSNFLLIMIFCFSFFFIQNIHAKEFHVADGRELFLAFSEASNNGENDIIYLAAGVYKGEFIFETIEAKSLTLTSEQGVRADQVVFDGEGMVRPLSFSSEYAADMAIINIAVRNGKTDGYGGGIFISTGGIVTFHKNVVYDNSGEYGGGVYIAKSGLGVLTLYNNSVLNNESYRAGGGIYAQGNGDFLINENDISKNNSEISYGGGIYTYSSHQNNNISFNNNNITKNNCRDGGGGIYAIGNNYVEYISFKGNNISENNCERSNSSENYGGAGIYTKGKSLYFDENNIKSNTSKGSSGGVFAYAYNELSLNNNIIIQNTSNYHGSGVYAKADILKLNNNIISKNISMYFFSGILIHASNNVFLLRNTIYQNICKSSTIANYRGSGIYLSNEVKNAVITNNNFKNNFSNSSATIMSFNTGNLIISKNTITQNKPNAIKSENASSITIDANIIKGSTGTGIHITRHQKTQSPVQSATT